MATGNELTGITLLMSQIVGEERGSVVTTYLILSCAERGRAVVITDDNVRIA